MALDSTRLRASLLLAATFVVACAAQPAPKMTLRILESYYGYLKAEASVVGGPAATCYALALLPAWRPSTAEVFKEGFIVQPGSGRGSREMIWEYTTSANHPDAATNVGTHIVSCYHGDAAPTTVSASFTVP